MCTWAKWYFLGNWQRTQSQKWNLEQPYRLVILSAYRIICSKAEDYETKNKAHVDIKHRMRNYGDCFDFSFGSLQNLTAKNEVGWLVSYQLCCLSSESDATYIVPISLDFLWAASSLFSLPFIMAWQHFPLCLPWAHHVLLAEVATYVWECFIQGFSHFWVRFWVVCLLSRITL